MLTPMMKSKKSQTGDKSEWERDSEHYEQVHYRHSKLGTIARET